MQEIPTGWFHMLNVSENASYNGFEYKRLYSILLCSSITQQYQQGLSKYLTYTTAYTLARGEANAQKRSLHGALMRIKRDLYPSVHSNRGSVTRNLYLQASLFTLPLQLHYHLELGHDCVPLHMLLLAYLGHQRRVPHAF